MGLLFAWLGQINAAAAQFDRARKLDPADPIGKEASRWLAKLVEARAARTQGPAR
jgi:hypothetical protein